MLVFLLVHELEAVHFIDNVAQLRLVLGLLVHLLVLRLGLLQRELAHWEDRSRLL